MDNRNFAYVKCCERNRNYIYFWFHGNSFGLVHYDADDPDEGITNEPIEYCPWCGILLDTNLLED